MLFTIIKIMKNFSGFLDFDPCLDLITILPYLHSSDFWILNPRLKPVVYYILVSARGSIQFTNSSLLQLSLFWSRPSEDVHV